jgi:hypothetical protein
MGSTPVARTIFHSHGKIGKLNYFRRLISGIFSTKKLTGEIKLVGGMVRGRGFEPLTPTVSR